MENLACPVLRRSAGWMAIGLLSLSHGVVFAEPMAVSPRWGVTFPSTAGGDVIETTAVPMNGEPVLVTVLTNGADPTRPALKIGNRTVASETIGNDPVSRLGFLKSTESALVKPLEWLENLSDANSTVLTAKSPTGMIRCRTNGWVKQVGTKVLPLALVKIGRAHV